MRAGRRSSPQTGDRAGGSVARIDWRAFISGLLGSIGAKADGRRALRLAMQQQLQSNWCWAAVTCSTSAYYLANTPWGQCTLVNAALEETTCCGDGASAACNQPWYLDRALRRTGNLGSRTAGPVAWEKIRSEIDAGRPIGARIGWSGGGGHFVLLTGYRSAGSVHEVEIQDPFTGRSMLPVDQFRTRYKSTGTWTHTYLTRS